MDGVRQHYANDHRLAARQRIWQTSRREPFFNLHSWVLGVARLDGSERVLDLGCGNGTYLELVDAVGLDASVGMLRAARSRSANPLTAGDAVALPFASDSFDVVLAAHMLYHVEERETAIAEIRRVLRPSGTLVAVTNSRDNQREMVELVETVVGGGWRWRRPSDVAFSVENGADQLRTNFRDVRVVTCPMGALLVTDTEALREYLDSVGDLYQAEIDQDWADVVRVCVDRVREIVEREGAFRLTSMAGAFVCGAGS